MAGAPEYQSRLWAFLSQVPDLVSELDAITQAEVQETLIGKDVPAAACDKLLSRNPDPGVRPGDYEVCLDVIEGLHCLTGAAISQERQRRIGITMAAGSQLEFGISLHALGDAWAHCEGGVMYGHTYGHLLARHDPDLISKRTGPYLDYVRNLYQVLSTKAPYVPCRPEVECPSLNEILEKLSLMAFLHPDDDKEQGQISYMRTLIDSMSLDKGLVTYSPAYDCVGWQNFVSSGAAAIGNLKAGDVDTIRGFGRRWRVTPVDGRDPAVRIAEAQRRAKARPGHIAAIEKAIVQTGSALV